ncbi:MAG: oligoribonuclease [Candidatus Endonucleobacter bathymodioli]|uniref:Oligoribonuclease n=1 Tax=Candidatus Endonucleibacter bathymodioli TaxID=539814 RepID=A0AA90P1M5_9GAMM|nr:oligoribonuclease [Candidatus Endonucleobacter bathymodioli]
MVKKHNLIWVDLEMTGLDPDKDRVIEIATIVTDGQLNEIAQGPVLAIHQSHEVLGSMGEWCVKTHNQTGLTERVRQSTVREREAEEQTLAFLQKHVDAGASPMCGNSIGQDRRFLYQYMRKLHDFFHYRNIDVSTLKELANRWRPELLSGLTKQGSHQALDDIKESIMEMRYYKKHFIQL